MRLELNINDSFFNSMDIEKPDVFTGDYTFYTRVQRNEEFVDAHVMQLKAMFFKQILKATSFEIFLTAGSKMNF